MLSWRSKLVFAAIFLSTLLVVLVIVLEVGQLVQHYVGPVKVRGSAVERIWVDAIVSGAFLILSGYALMFLAAYAFFTHRISRWRRLAVSVALFVVAFAVFMFLVGDSISPLSIGLLFAGSIGVVISDAAANAVEERVSRKE